MSPVGMSLLLGLSLALFTYSAVRRWRLMCVGGPEAAFSIRNASELFTRIRNTLVYAFGQKKMPYYRSAGIAHMLIFFGFMVLLLRSVILWGRGYDLSFDFFGLLASGSLLGNGYSLLKDIFAALVILGASVFVYYRVLAPQRRMTLGFEGLLILFIIISMMVADMLYDGASLLIEARTENAEPLFHLYEPAGSVFAIMLSKVTIGSAALTFLKHAGFWWHSAFVLIFLNLLPYSKHFHVITAIPNVFAASGLPAGALPKVEDLEGKVEREEALGISKLQDLSWKDILDLYTCTECGRCSDNCPAYTTDKKLSPKHLTLAIRDHLYDSEKALLGDGGVAELSSASKDVSKLAVHGNPPPDAYFRSATPLGLVPAHRSPRT